MRIKPFILLSLLTANCFGQELPPPPPPPPPPIEPPVHIESFPSKKEKTEEFDITVHKPLCQTLMKSVNNECEGLRNLSGSAIHFVLPESYNESDSRFTKGKGKWINIIEFPKIFKYEFYSDSISRLMSGIENSQQFQEQININGVKSYFVETINKEFGFAIAFLITGNEKTDYLIQFTYDLTDHKTKKEILNFIYTICYKEVTPTNPLNEISITIDTSYTHFLPQRIGKQMLLFTSKEDYSKGLRSASPKFQITEIGFTEISTDEILQSTFSTLTASGFECKTTEKYEFKVDDTRVEVREYEASLKNMSTIMYMYLAVFKTDYSTISFAGMCMNDLYIYKELWEKTVRSIKKKKK